MVSIKTDNEITSMKKAGSIVYKTLRYLEKHIKPGVTTERLNELAEQYIIDLGGTPSFKDYNGFPKVICTSVNEQVVHGIPGEYALKAGDIISIDIGVCYNGYHSDGAYTYKIGEIDKDKAYLLEHTEKALYEGLKEIRPGKKLGDVSHRIGKYAEEHNLKVFKELIGHGIGKKLHEEPDIPNYGEPNTGIVLKAGMTFAIEPMMTLGNGDIGCEMDGWTIITLDNKPAAHFEHTIVVTHDGYQILTGEWLDG